MISKSTISILKDIYSFSESLKFSKILMVGGVARDLYLNGKVLNNKDFSFSGDFDLTCNNGGQTALLGLLYCVKTGYSFKYYKKIIYLCF